MLWFIVLGALATLSFGLQFWQWWGAQRFPLHKRHPNPNFFPSLTLLKPLRGNDPETRACLQTWLEQDYAGPVQILFGVASENDPVCAVVRALLAEYPQVQGKLIICPEMLGPNGKVTTLIQLEREAVHGILVISDADVAVPRDLLTQLVLPLADPEVGVTHCFYRFANPANAAMRTEAVAVNADFWSQVLQARAFGPLQFAMGAVMAVRRDALAAAGGLRPLLDYLADDYQLGNRIARTGRRVELCPVVVDCRERLCGWAMMGRHQLRWARTIRTCQPVPFFLSILSNATVWPLLWLAFFPRTAAVASVFFLGFRVYAAWDLQKRLTGPNPVCFYPWLVPVKDLLHLGVWLGAFLGNEVEWRGEKLRMRQGGKLERVADAPNVTM